MKDIIISVIIPAYNSQNTIQKCLNSIISQKPTDIEIIVIDDGSSDSTVDVVKDIQKNTDIPIRLYMQKNEGPGVARNNGIKKAKGEYVAFLDSDDYFDEEYFELVYKAISEKKADVVFIGTVNEKENGKVIRTDHMERFINKNKDDIINLQTAGIISWGPCSKIVKKRIASNCRFSRLKVGEDAIYSYSVLNDSASISFVSKAIYHYVYSCRGQHTKGGDNPWGELLIAMRQIIDKNENKTKHDEGYYHLFVKSKIINIYRLSGNLKYKESIKAIGLIAKETVSAYSKVNKKNTEYSTRAIIFLLRAKIYFPIIIASRIRRRLRGGVGA